MVLRTLRKEGEEPTSMKVLLMAPTGTAAHNIQGLTIHSALQLQLGQHGKRYQRLGGEKHSQMQVFSTQINNNR